MCFVFSLSHLSYSFSLTRSFSLSFTNVNSASYVRERDYRDRALDEQDLKWLFPKTMNKVGIYRDFATLPQDQRLVSLI